MSHDVFNVHTPTVTRTNHRGLAPLKPGVIRTVRYVDELVAASRWRRVPATSPPQRPVRHQLQLDRHERPAQRGQGWHDVDPLLRRESARAVHAVDVPRDGDPDRASEHDADVADTRRGGETALHCFVDGERDMHERTDDGIEKDEAADHAAVACALLDHGAETMGVDCIASVFRAAIKNGAVHSAIV